MKNKNETGGKLFCFVIFVKQPHDNTLNCFKEKRKKFSVFKEEVAEFRINGKDTVSVLNIDYLKRHRGTLISRTELPLDEAGKLWLQDVMAISLARLLI